MNVISINGLEKRYAEKYALKGVSFDVKKGEIFALVGPNGSGKTTTLEILMGLQPYDGGAVVFRDVETGLETSKLKIGPVFQEPVYYATLTVRQLLKFYSRFYVSPVKSMEHRLKSVCLEDKMDTQYQNLSGGQKQQLSIVLSLVNDPDVLFFDEPSTALDPQVRHKIWDLIRNLKEEGKTIILTTHYIEEAEALADRVSILNAGEVVITDEPSNIIGKYNTHYAIEMQIDGSIDKEKFSGYGFANVQAVGGSYRFSVPTLESGVFESIRKIAEEHNILNFRIGKSSLEDVFVQLTHEEAR